MAKCRAKKRSTVKAERRLDDDLPGVPRVRRAVEPARRPPVPAVQRIAVEDVGTDLPGQPPEPEHAPRPPQGVGHPGAGVVAGTDPVHRHHVQDGPGRLELSRHWRRGREGNVHSPPVGGQLADHAQEGLVRTSPLGHRLH